MRSERSRRWSRLYLCLRLCLRLRLCLIPQVGSYIKEYVYKPGTPHVVVDLRGDAE